MILFITPCMTPASTAAVHAATGLSFEQLTLLLIALLLLNEAMETQSCDLVVTVALGASTLNNSIYSGNSRVKEALRSMVGSL